MNDQLWLDFPKDSMAFERKFGSERACRRYLIRLRWGGPPRCTRCESKVWELSNGRLECRSCGYQGSVTAGTIFHRSPKPLTLWFRAIWEMVTRKNGISAKDLQRVMGFGSYETAWRWLHKLRSLLDPRSSPSLTGSVQLDEGQVGLGRRVGRSKRPENKVLVAAERGGRLRMAKGPDETKATVTTFLDTVVGPDARLTADRHGSHHATILGDRLEHSVLSETSRTGPDPLQHCHWALALLKRWWLGTHHGAIRGRYAQVYLDEFVFRYNRRKTQGIGRIVARVLERAVIAKPLSQTQMRIRDEFPWFPQHLGPQAPDSIG